MGSAFGRNKMKTCILLLLAGATLALGKPLEIQLRPNKDYGDRDYEEQLIQKFNALLEGDKDLAAQFSAFEAAPKEQAGGRYMGYKARPLLLHQFVEVDFKDSGGTQDYTQTVVLYYSFAQGFHRGMEETSGVFAVFHLVGQRLYDHEDLVKHTVTAKFDGFRRTLNAEEDVADQPTTQRADKSSAKAQPDAKAEAERSFKQADADLNKTYQQLQLRLESPQAKADLAKAQRAWIALRDSESALRAGVSSGGGSAYSTDFMANQAELTEQRTQQLNALLSHLP